MLRNNQIDAIQCSVNNNFSSGVHFHATGTGKSWIALEIIIKYNELYSNSNIIWVCEQKSILIEQFNRKNLKEKGYGDIFKKFLVINYTLNKPKNWFSLLSSAKYWQKPILLVINRAFLVSGEKYTKINLDFHLIIHDECHSIVNKTTRKFYKFQIEKNPNISCIGFSATPNLEYYPFNKILTDYTIYNAFCEDIIVPPKIIWVSSDKNLKDIDYLNICKYKIKKLYYKKVIVWCGTIKKCYELSKLWKSKLPNFNVFVDTSKENDESYEIFSNINSEALLFCAGKHREGSDIKNLDCCIFLDKVSKRNPKTFVQCVGRVLRKDKSLKKKYGLVIDFEANSCIAICDRLNSFLNCSDNFPWDYNYKFGKIGKKKIILHQLCLNNISNLKKNNNLKEYSLQDLKTRFKRCLPETEEYNNRLKFELKLIKEKKIINYLIRATEILEMTNYIPHVTRGSCGSSLVCYALGISNVDPVKNKISFSRFINKYRDTLPDIDFDFPHYLRDEVFLKLELNWPNQVARISNQVHWHHKSALREALRVEGYNKRIPKEEIYTFVQNLPSEKRNKVINYKNKLQDSFRHYSLHCGGIVFFHEGIPSDLIINKKTLSQVIYDKNDISKIKSFKIDILSSKGLSQLIDICGREIEFNEEYNDIKTYQLLQKGDNIGITLAESPLMRKALLKIKPKNIHDIAICLAIIRPAAKDARCQNNEIDYETEFIYDDDAIKLISRQLNIDEELADKYRRCLSKNKWNSLDKLNFDNLLSCITIRKREKLLTKLSNLRKYSFCKSHSYSYAQLVYKLAYQKAHNPLKFWKSTLKNSSSSYRKWVHLFEASRVGINIIKNINDKKKSVYSENRNNNFNSLSFSDQIKRYGYWDMNKYSFFANSYLYKKDEIYYFGGLIASLRIINWKNKLIVCSICVNPGLYIEVTTKDVYYNSKYFAIKGRANLIDKKTRTFKAIFAKFY